MRKLVKIIAIGLFAVSVLQGCGKPAESYQKYDYAAAHNSTNNILMFESSDKGLDSFLNDFFERHSRYSEDRIHTHPVGAGGSAWKDWESLIGDWWDSSYSFNNTLPKQYATKDYIENWLLSPKQDNQGYIWCDSGLGPTAWGMGWAFPTYEQSGVGYDFNMKTDWTVSESAIVTLTDTFLPGDASREMTASATNVSEIAVTSPNMSVGAFYVPFLKTCWGFQNTGDGKNIDDLYVYFQTSGDTDFSEDKMVKYSEFSLTGSKINGDVAYNMSCFPMYEHSAWGRLDSNSITKIKIVLKAKEGATISGNLKFDFVNLECDDRQANNIGNYISAAESFLSYAQNPELLAHIMPKVRKAFMTYYELLDGKNGLMSTHYYVGHDNLGGGVAGSGISDGYWDVLAFPDVNLYTNLSYYRAIQAMIYLEQMCLTYGVKVDETTIKSKDMTEDLKYNLTLDDLTLLENKCKSDFREYFWNEKKGRFIAGYYEGDKNEIQDNGYLTFNLQAIECGLATAEQGKQIMSWISGEREIKGDNSTGSDIYEFEFAPRNTTKQNYVDYSFVYSGSAWGTGVHNGGAVMQTSYYDIVSRNIVNGADDAYKRLKGIQSWYEKVAKCGGKGWNFYRAYYGDAMQGGATGGPVGLDYEFLEAALMYVSIPTAFFGISPTATKSLNISPSMPIGLDYWKMENLTYGDYYYDVSISKYFVQVSSVRNKDGSSNTLNGHTINISINKPNFKFDVHYNGEQIKYKEENGKIVVNVPFTNGKVEIVGSIK